MSALHDLTARLTLPYRRGAELFSLPVSAPSGGTSAIPAYEFAEYRAKWGENPKAPTYVIAPRSDTGIDDISVTVNYTWNGPKTVTLTIPGSTPALTGFPIALPREADATLRLVSIVAAPALRAVDGAAWDVTVLLGTIAKLSWLIGAEKDAVRRLLPQIRSQRFVDAAIASGLDAIGRDLRIPRFPPRPYGYDDALVALWHLDDPAAVGGQVVDVTTRGTIPGHPGTISGAVSRAPGKYGTAFAFAPPGGAVVVPSSPGFNIAANADATVEAFVDAVVPADGTPRAIIARRASETAAASTVAGWSLCVVNARGIDANVQFAVCDGTRETRCFADLSIADGGFHHVAGVIDRAGKRARLLVDGILRASSSIEGFGAIAPAVDVRLGSTGSGNTFVGVIDEVRISSIARDAFHPALGESDEAYRARLRIFRNWVLPTPERVISLVNEAAPIGNEPAPYVLIERNRPTQVAGATVRVVPATVPAGTAIALDGGAARDEMVAGTPDDDEGFDPALDLLVYANAAVDVAGCPGGPRMQAAAARRLDALVARLAGAGITGKVVLAQAYDASGPTPLHKVGRALRIRHETHPLDQLAALAHRAGFAYVGNFGSEIAVAAAADERLIIRSTPTAAARVDVNAVFDLTLDPAMPESGTFAWTIVSPESAQASLSAHSADPATLKTPVATRPRVRLMIEAAGELVVRAEFTYRNVTRSGTLLLRCDPVSLATGHAIDAAGNLDPDLAAIAGQPESDFAQTDLDTHPPNTAIDFGTVANNTHMQVSTRVALDGLVALLLARGVSGRLKVTNAFDPAGSGVEKVGRLLVLGHETLDAGILAALAARFFDYVSRNGTAVTVCVRPASRIAVVDAATSAPLAGEVVLNTPLNLSVLPTTLAAGTYSWSTNAADQGAGSFSVTARSTTQLTPTRPGFLTLTVIYVATNAAGTTPYTFEVALKPSLDTPATTIPKPQYDIIMNVLDAFHPIGVEVRTDRLRSHVREVEQDPTKAFPAYSFPDFRL
jgi:hypothetical protein